MARDPFGKQLSVTWVIVTDNATENMPPSESFAASRIHAVAGSNPPAYPPSGPSQSQRFREVARLFPRAAGQARPPPIGGGRPQIYICLLCALAFRPGRAFDGGAGHRLQKAAKCAPVSGTAPSVETRHRRARGHQRPFGGLLGPSSWTVPAPARSRSGNRDTPPTPKGEGAQLANAICPPCATPPGDAPSRRLFPKTRLRKDAQFPGGADRKPPRSENPGAELRRRGTAAGRGFEKSPPKSPPGFHADGGIRPPVSRKTPREFVTGCRRRLPIQTASIGPGVVIATGIFPC